MRSENVVGVVHVSANDCEHSFEHEYSLLFSFSHGWFFCPNFYYLSDNLNTDWKNIKSIEGKSLAKLANVCTFICHIDLKLCFQKNLSDPFLSPPVQYVFNVLGHA